MSPALASRSADTHSHNAPPPTIVDELVVWGSSGHEVFVWTSDFQRIQELNLEMPVVQVYNRFCVLFNTDRHCHIFVLN
jgi:hypothetical protein